MKRIAVVGAGWMAHVRVKALVDTGRAQVVGVATRHLATAQKFSAELGCTACFDDYRQLLGIQPDAVLVEVPHEAQDAIVLWALQQGLHVLIGGTPATTSDHARQIAEVAQQKALVVEAGYEARYSPAWVYARQLIVAGDIGKLVTVRSIALWNGDPRTWYYQQQSSGGMPLTHMTYCFINPVRWVAGEVRAVSAFTSRVKHTAPELVHEENCVASLLLADDVLYSLTAGFVAPGGLPAWSATYIGTQGALEVRPDEAGSGTVMAYLNGAAIEHDFRMQRNAFEVQASAFIAALDGGQTLLNTPADTLGDVLTAEAVVVSAREGKMIWM